MEIDVEASERNVVFTFQWRKKQERKRNEVGGLSAVKTGRKFVPCQEACSQYSSNMLEIGNGKQGGTKNGRVPFAPSDIHKLRVSAEPLSSSTLGLSRLSAGRRPNGLWPSMELGSKRSLRRKVSEQTENEKPGDNVVTGKQMPVKTARWNQMNRLNVSMAWSSGRYPRAMSTDGLLKVTQLASKEGKNLSSNNKTIHSNRKPDENVKTVERSDSAPKVLSFPKAATLAPSRALSPARTLASSRAPSPANFPRTSSSPAKTPSTSPAITSLISGTSSTPARTPSPGKVASPFKSRAPSPARISSPSKVSPLAKLPSTSGTTKVSPRPTMATVSSNSFNKISSRALSPMKFLSPVQGFARTQPSSVKVPTHPALRAPSPAKVSSRARPTYDSELDGVYTLRILHNRYLQWRFIIARFQAAFRAKDVLAKRLLFNAWLHVSKLQASVALRKRTLSHAVQRNKLASLIDSHSKGLEHWSSLGGRHAAALCDMIQALDDAMLRLPLCSGAKGNPREIFNEVQRARGAIAFVEDLACRFLPKAEERGRLALELAGTVAHEKDLIRECFQLLEMVTSLEIEERSLRVQFMQA